MGAALARSIAKAAMMDSELLDRYLLDGAPDKATVVKQLLGEKHPAPAVRPYLEGLRTLGARVPDLALIALRLVLAGKRSDDASVVRLKTLVEAAREEGPGAQTAREAYQRELQP